MNNYTSVDRLLPAAATTTRTSLLRLLPNIGAWPIGYDFSSIPSHSLRESLEDKTSIRYFVVVLTYGVDVVYVLCWTICTNKELELDLQVEVSDQSA